MCAKRQSIWREFVYHRREAVLLSRPLRPRKNRLIPYKAWERIYVDRAQWMKWLLPVVVDALSRWPEVFIVNFTSASQTIDKSRTIFAMHDLRVTIVSNDGPPFSSSEFESCTKANGITHCRVPLYQPSSNGLAENMVKSLKQALNKASKKDTTETKIAKFLMSYRNTPHPVTGKTCRSPFMSVTKNMFVIDPPLYVTTDVHHHRRTSR